MTEVSQQERERVTLKLQVTGHPIAIEEIAHLVISLVTMGKLALLEFVTE